jgi:hypothetical protein
LEVSTFELRGLSLARQMLYHLSHSATPVLYWIFLFFFCLWVFFFCLIHMCIQCLGHFSPFPHPLCLPPTSSIPGRNYFALISNFVEERV